MDVRLSLAFCALAMLACHGVRGRPHEPHARVDAGPRDAGHRAEPDKPRCGPTSAELQGATPSVGAGEIEQPAIGPGPFLAAQQDGACFVLVKNWDFGTAGSIRDVNDLVAEFQFHDQFNTIANGSNYGAVIVAPTEATAIPVFGLKQPNNRQPVEDPARPNREWTRDTLKAHVLPLSKAQTSASVSEHNAGSGSLASKWRLAKGGALLGKDMLWETRVRMPRPRAAYWFALWTAGNKWNHGAEMDVLEAFGAPNVYPPATLFHVSSCGGRDTISYKSWPAGLLTAGVPHGERDLTEWHVWTWQYLKDDTYKVFFDQRVVQSGSIHWTRKGEEGGEPIDMIFLWDFTWGHIDVPGVNIELPASEVPLTYEIDYSRVYLR
jgi:hypothetical protein